MLRPIEVAPGVRVPAAAQSFTATRASGPGGQNVNKVASRVELRIVVSAIEGLDEGARFRLLALAGRRLVAGELLFTSQRTRDQGRNLEDAQRKALELITAALPAPRRRRPSRPSRGAVERRLTSEKQRAETKRVRRAPADD